MKIPSSYRSAPEVADRSPSPAAARPAAPAAAPGGSAQVALSATSAALQSSSGDVNLERVQALRDAIRSGQLQIDAGRIADGLIDSTRELLQGQAGSV